MLIFRNYIILTNEEKYEYLETILELNILLGELQIQVVYV